jgi:uncharacterized membrane protein
MPEEKDSTPPTKRFTYDPKGTATATHDLRVQKDEALHQDDLQPLENQGEKTISIKVSEYERLRKNENFEILGLQLEKTTLPEDEALKLIKATASQSLNKIIGQREQELKKKFEEKERKLTIKTTPKKEKTKLWPKLLIGIFAAGMLILMFLTFKPAGTTAVSTPGVRIVTRPETQKQAIGWALYNAKQEILWLSSTPDIRVIDKIREFLDYKHNTGFLIITDSRGAPEFHSIAEQTGITTHRFNGSLGNTNRLIIDKSLIIELSSPTATIMIPDSNAATALYLWIDTVLAPNSEVLYQ